MREILKNILPHDWDVFNPKNNLIDITSIILMALTFTASKNRDANCESLNLCMIGSITITTKKEGKNIQNVAIIAPVSPLTKKPIAAEVDDTGPGDI